VDLQRGRLEIPEGVPSLTLGPLDLRAGKLAGLLDKPAPEFAGIMAWRNGPVVSLADLRGKVVILDFWNYACTICCAEMPELFEMHRKYASKGLVIIGVHSLLPTPAEDFDRRTARLVAGAWKKQAVPFRLALDPRGKDATSSAYGITAVPAIVIIDRAGKLVAEFGSPADAEFKKTVEKLLGT
jgi:peroxiredoxin